jgi:hypothetical protein
MNLDTVIKIAINPALARLPMKLDSTAARVMLLAIGQQESRFIYRAQVGGPAKSFWQFEEGGGVKGVMNHEATSALCFDLCKDRDVRFDRHAIYLAMETDDILAAGMARLLLYADAKPLPNPADPQAGWDCYIRNWRPGKPHRETWDAFHANALAAVTL